ncbi:Energy-coupling factor transporter ATP-binding protein EcfA 1 [[Clostridium] ultunense Esp]|nr:Energy-coupling factor transporter ATP-binding protein EcfA 1 [[Clostridium] ultunense Esp]
MEPILTAEDLYFRYSESGDWVLKGVNIALYPGEWVGILGGNGSGKSTLAKLLNGLLLPQKGTVKIFGLNPNVQEDLPLIHQKVGMIFQNPENQIVAMTVEDDIAFGLENLGLPLQEIERRTDQVLEQMKLTPYRKTEPHRLSGGQKQRLAIAGVLAMRPEVIIFDEAASMLDPEGAYELLQTMIELHRQKITLVHITHELEEIRYADRLIVMEGGRILAEGRPMEVLIQVETLKKAALLPPFAVRLWDRLAREGIRLP